MNDVDVVVVGASLGGLAAFETIVRQLPERPGPPVVLVQHRSPDFEGQLGTLLQTHCALPVVEPGDRTRIEPGHVYVAPANYHLLLDRECFWLSIDPPVWYARPSIDVTFESAADAFGKRTLCVMLTSGSDDGVAGAHAIKKAGGRVYVQDPATAEAPTAPRGVLARTPVDGVLSVQEIAALLSGLPGARF
jgi:two-component system, chemotaxis family, protein-glutamate methylesterase/glutaminase